MKKLGGALKDKKTYVTVAVAVAVAALTAAGAYLVGDLTGAEALGMFLTAIRNIAGTP